MTVDPTDLLEKRVRQLVELVKRLSDENRQLDRKVRSIGQQLAKRDRQSVRWTHDRSRLRSRVERILAEVGSMEALPADTRPSGGKSLKPRKRGDA